MLSRFCQVLKQKVHLVRESSGLYYGSGCHGQVFTLKLVLVCVQSWAWTFYCLYVGYAVVVGSGAWVAYTEIKYSLKIIIHPYTWLL